MRFARDVYEKLDGRWGEMLSLPIRLLAGCSSGADGVGWSSCAGLTATMHKKTEGGQERKKERKGKEGGWRRAGSTKGRQKADGRWMRGLDDKGTDGGSGTKTTVGGGLKKERCARNTRTRDTSAAVLIRHVLLLLVELNSTAVLAALPRLAGAWLTNMLLRLWGVGGE
jgi:hypothetical protein